MEAVLWQVLAGTRGGPNRAQLLKALRERPRNRNQLANDLELNYKTVEHHLDVLEDNGIVESTDSDYGAVYLLTDRAEQHWDQITEITKQIQQ
ncbi:MAG: winged helix-turn-helix domain-containing protein [Halovenus sp.]